MVEYKHSTCYRERGGYEMYPPLGQRVFKTVIRVTDQFCDSSLSYSNSLKYFDGINTVCEGLTARELANVQSFSHCSIC